jgi:hypothetical protein
MKAAFALLALAAAGCQVNVDANTQAKLDNAEASIEGAAESAGNLAESAAGTVENAADQVGNGVDVNVDLHGGGNDSAAANRQ